MISLFQYPVLTVLLYGNINRTVDEPPNEVMQTAVRELSMIEGSMRDRIES